MPPKREAADAAASEVTKKQKKSFTCVEPGCSKTFSIIGHLNRHIKSVHDKIKHVCPEKGCGKEYASKTSLEDHIKYVHAGDKLVCPERGCGKEYTRKSSLDDHIKSVHNGNKHVCSEKGCGKEFTLKSSLQTHINAVHDKTRHVCSEKGCGKEFSQKSGLQKHLKYAHDKIKHVCSEKDCGKEFSQKSGLKRHLETAHASPEEAAEMLKQKHELQQLLAYKEAGRICSATKSCQNLVPKDSFRCSYHMKSANIIDNALKKKREAGTLSESSIIHPGGFDLLLRRPQVTLEPSAKSSLHLLASGIQEAFFIDVEFVWARRYLPLDLTIMRANGEEVFSDRIDYNMSIEHLRSLCPDNEEESSVAGRTLKKVYGRAANTWGKTPDQVMDAIKDARISSDAIF